MSRIKPDTVEILPHEEMSNCGIDQKEGIIYVSQYSVITPSLKQRLIKNGYKIIECERTDWFGGKF